MLRTSLTAKEWARLRAYVATLDAKAKSDLRHRIDYWTESVAIELAHVAAGLPKLAAGERPTGKYAHSLDRPIIEQVATWLK